MKTSVVLAACALMVCINFGESFLIRLKPAFKLDPRDPMCELHGCKIDI